MKAKEVKAMAISNPVVMIAVETLLGDEGEGEGEREGEGKGEGESSQLPWILFVHYIVWRKSPCN